MTTLDPEQTGALPRPRATTGSSAAGVSGGLRGLVQVTREALDRPLTAYYLLLGATALLLTIGLLMVLSASSVYSYKFNDGDSYAVVKRQLMWVGIGLPLAWVASRMPLRSIRLLAFPGYAVSLVLLAATIFAGKEINGNRNWLGVGPFVIQPAEIAKLALIIWAAHIYANKERRLGELHQMMVPVVPGMLLATAFVLAGRDLGTALVFFALMLGVLWVVGAPGKIFAFGISVLGTLAFALAWVSPERMARLTNFLDPFADFHKTGWQPAHGLYALSTGSWFGQGIGASQQKWGDLPEAHTDFIFAVLGEELGLVGTLLVIGLFLTLAFACLRVARDTQEPFVRYATFGVVVWLLGQTMINLGMVLTLLPVIGLPLPLISYGGSSLLPTLVALGMVIGFARREPEAARALARRRRRGASGLSAGPVS